MDSPTTSQRTVSDDEEIDYSIKPELYGPELDNEDELWAHNQRKGRASDAVLSCPACFTALCLECQRHEKYVTQYRAIFVVNCKIGETKRNLQMRPNSNRHRRKRRRETEEEETELAGGEAFRQVCCSNCSTEVGVFDEDEIYHFFNVLPREIVSFLCLNKVEHSDHAHMFESFFKAKRRNVKQGQPKKTYKIPNNSINKIKVRRQDQARMSSICKGKSSWPELVGEDGQRAKQVIEQENPLVTAVIVGPGSAVPEDFRCDRVWVWVDEEGKVTSVSNIG